MSFVPADYHTSSHNTSHPSLSLAPQQLEPHGHEAQFIPADPLWDDVLSFAEFGANTSPILSRQTSLQGTSFRNVNPLGHHHSVNGQPRQSGVPSSAPRVHQQSTRSEAIQHIVHPAVALQSPFDGAYTLLTHPSASFPVRLAPTTTPAAASSFAWANPAIPMPVPGPSTGAPAPMVRPWNADVPQDIPATCCRCRMPVRAQPLVRVHDTIEWVRPDVMKMVLLFNWSVNADAEAHEPWEEQRS
ncbi:hypothetical protein B0F90DRAFT_1817177 [Multifurca ochricompacta]|uniref:Uncharacterized protein n=1 Tax=Multifurca ochricompacta TaxID=376703 RepID=A0AAD4QL31_9AGAM|nr:hypothetical protein B0F90DRAFT_1817177 [Multifurca ochricompacta]